MAVNVNINIEKEKSVVHHVPCVIKKNGNANVSKYFQRNIVEQNGVLQTSFRGYPLQGKEIEIPSNYVGVILQEKQDSLTDNSNRQLYTIGSFNKLTYWNYDKQPSKNDHIVSVMDWMDIASALHSPIDS